MDAAADHTVKEAKVHTEESGYGAIVAVAIALFFLAFVAHAATLPAEDTGSAPPAGTAAQKAAH